MTEAKLDRVAAETVVSEAEAVGAAKKLAVLPAPPHPPRDSRPITNLGKVFGQFAELQQQIAEQVVALEDSVQHQKQDVAAAMAQLPELRERINWLIASFYEQSKKDESVRDRLGRHDSAIETLTATVQAIEAQHKQLMAVFGEVVNGLLRAQALMSPAKE